MVLCHNDVSLPEGKYNQPPVWAFSLWMFMAWSSAARSFVAPWLPMTLTGKTDSSEPLLITSQGLLQVDLNSEGLIFIYLYKASVRPIYIYMYINVLYII